MDSTTVVTNQTSLLSGMHNYFVPVLQYKFQMIALNNHLFALGGLTPQGFTHSVERYDLTTNEWEYAAPLTEPRYRHAACVTSRGKVSFYGQQHF